jgi:hypothetical protein
MKDRSEYYQANKELIKQRALNHYYEHRHERLEYLRQYYLENREYIRAYRAERIPKTRCRKEKPPKIPKVRHTQQKAPKEPKAPKPPAPPKFEEASYIISFE